MDDLKDSSCRQRHARQGSVVVMVAFCIVFLLIVLVFCVDVAFMQLTRTELRIAVDASARAAAESLSRTQSTAQAEQAAQDTAAANQVAGVSFTLPAADIVFGRVTITGSSTSSFVPNATPPNAVRIQSGRTQNRPDGTVSLFFGQLLGRGNFAPEQSAIAAQLDRDMALVLDRSGSMADDGKFDSLLDAVNAFLNEIAQTPQTELVSASVYAETAEKVIDLTDNHSAVSSALGQIETGGHTAIGLGLQMGINSLKNDAMRRPLAEPTIVLMTDGIHNTGVDPEVTILEAPANFIVHTITFGANADQQRMIDLAATRNGEHFHAPTGSALIDIFREIGATLPVVLTN